MDVMAQSLSADERETVIVANQADGIVRIETSIRTHITALRKKDAAIETKTEMFGTTEIATFEIPFDEWSPTIGIKRHVNMSEERKAELAERLKAMRAK